MNVYPLPESFRDLTILRLGKQQTLVLSCDSCGGIGSKEQDVVQVSPDITGYYTAMVTLAELLSVGARPVCIINTLAAEMVPTGNRVNEGIVKALREINLSDDFLITGSTEENMSMVQTALGITAVGIVENRSWKPLASKADWYMYAVGFPKVGPAVVQDDEKTILTLPDYAALSGLAGPKEIIPVGSKGIRYEAGLLAEMNNLNIRWTKSITLDIDVSAGPATCAVVSLPAEHEEALKRCCRKPVTRIGTLTLPS